MREFAFQIVAARGLHARVAAELAQMIETSKSLVYLTKGEKSENLSRVMKVLALGIRPGDVVRVTVMGEDEEGLCERLKQYFTEKL